MPISAPDLFRQTVLTRVVNELKSPLSFLRDLLFSREETYPTETLELATIDKARKMAPFVRRDGEARLVGGYDRTVANVQAPNIRLKRPFTPSELLFGRQPGNVVYVRSQGQILQQIGEHIRRDLQVVNDEIENTKEWLASQALQGSIAYQVADEENFTITYPRSGSRNITLTTFWDDATPADTDVNGDFHTVKRLQSTDSQVPVTDVILGQEAADSFMSLLRGGHIKLTNRTDSLLEAGVGRLDTQFLESGAIWLGDVGGIRVWEYSRQVVHPDGSTVDLIRPKYAEFISRNNSASASDRIMAYAAIPDMEALEGRVMQAKRFSKSWITKDPSARVFLIHSRPLPVLRRPNATVSMKVVSG